MWMGAGGGTPLTLQMFLIEIEIRNDKTKLVL